MSETAPDLMRRLGLDLPGLGLAAEVEWNPAARLQVEQMQREQQYFGKCIALGLTVDDARMILDREIALAAEYRLSLGQMWAGAWDQAIRHCMREPYVKFPNRDQYEAANNYIASARPAQENAVDWNSVEINVVDRTPRPPTLHPVLQPAIGDETMQSLLKAAAGHPQFQAPTRQPISISVAPAGTDPRDEGSFLSLDGCFERLWLNRPVAANETTAERPTIRMVGDRRMQCKDIPDEAFLEAVHLSRSSGHYGNRGTVRDLLEQELGNIPENLILAKARRLIDRKIIDGCGCGCRGDFEVLP